MPHAPNRILQRLRRTALPGAEAQAAFAFQDRLDHSQWMTKAEIETYQLYHLKSLVRFAAGHVEAYRDRIAAASVLQASTLASALAAIPVLKRSSLAEAPMTFKADTLPAGHHLAGTRKSSGTTGTLVEVDVTDISYGWQNALGLRSYLWSGWDFSKLAAGIRYERTGVAAYPEGATVTAWDAPTIFPFPTGPAAHLGVSASLEEQWEWLGRIQPAYLITYPSVVRAFATRAEREGHGPCRLRGIATVGETLDTDLRDNARRHLGADIHDSYSSQEIGLIACQCPSNRRYHANDEAVIVEILREDGSAARAGETGRVVVTPLFNYASPLLRYDIGDVAEAGAPCACGRGLTTINRIIGRHRNIFRLRDGRSFWPAFGVRSLTRFLPVRQHQFRQLDFDTIEVVMATSVAGTHEIEEKMREHIGRRLPAPLTLRFTYVDSIPREPGGKYQEFICLLPPDA